MKAKLGGVPLTEAERAKRWEKLGREAMWEVARVDLEEIHNLLDIIEELLGELDKAKKGHTAAANRARRATSDRLAAEVKRMNADGRSVAYIATKTGKSRVWVKELLKRPNSESDVETSRK